jgi:hypothetical protein
MDENFERDLMAEDRRERAGKPPLAKTERGEAYIRYVKLLSNAVQSLKHKADMEALNTEIRSATPGNTQTVTVLQNLSVAYQNDEYIGDRLLPVVTTTEAEGLSIEYWKRTKPELFGAPDDTMTTDADANDVSASAETASVSLEKKALKAHIDVWNRNMMSNIVLELIEPTASVSEAMAFNREVRQAAILCAYANFGTNYGALSAGDRWDSVGGGDPGGAVDSAKGALWKGAGATQTIGYCSWDVYRVLKRHKQILESFKYQGGRPMQATRAMLAEFFELDDLLVGYSRKQATNEGQASQTYSRVWSNVFGLVRVSRTPSRRSLAFGSTFAQAPYQSTWFDQSKGGKGVQYTQIAVAEKSAVVAADAGYLITTPIG